jgi:hypothetical protein
MTSSKIRDSVPTPTFDAVVIHRGMLRRGWCLSTLQWPAEYGVIIDFAAGTWRVSMVDDQSPHHPYQARLAQDVRIAKVW